ncbi:ankyrin repeat-containing protein BDA1-like [Solanum stenotomum]|uniref:ankyrin repeat-containing protein BDA1-like n=1 Tax=Solanum stenotomum TaxID=172797 RepID=UPI0020D131DD|nr:ankyrin repeat-containing protein BDA1-like [Solanum stenotomum]XP_049378271.1 ankyrin repeat-containing protein BDA1-like [Solanum stenotomum]
MDRRLWEAAKTGDVHHLQSLIKEDPLLLRAVSLAEYAGELNQDGFSPLHIASVNGDIEIVKEILNVDSNLCLLKGKDRRIPLHYAVIKGREHVMKELLVVSPDSAEEVTARGETCLHLAVKNYQFEAFKFLLDNLKDLNKYGLLNKKDIQGNTVLHLAVSTKQYEVVDMLLGENVVSKGTIEVNSLNKKGLTPLEVLLEESEDTDIEEILRASGALSAENLQSLQQQVLPQSWVVPFQDPSNEQSSREQRKDLPRSRAKKLQDFFKYNKSKDCPGKVRDTLLVIAILIATATYQAVFSPPGGVWQDTYWPDDNNNSSHDGKMSLRHIAGQSVMGTNYPISYGLFLVFNSIGFFVSLHTINFLTIGFPLQLELQVSLVALVATYDTVMSAITPNQGISLFFFIFSVVFSALFPFITMMLRNYCKKPRFLS